MKYLLILLVFLCSCQKDVEISKSVNHINSKVIHVNLQGVPYILHEFTYDSCVYLIYAETLILKPNTSCNCQE